MPLQLSLCSSTIISSKGAWILYRGLAPMTSTARSPTALLHFPQNPHLVLLGLDPSILSVLPVSCSRRSREQPFLIHPHSTETCSDILIQAAEPRSFQGVFPGSPSWDQCGGSLLPRVHLQPLPLLRHPSLPLPPADSHPWVFHPMQGGQGGVRGYIWVGW